MMRRPLACAFHLALAGAVVAGGAPSPADVEKAKRELLEALGDTAAARTGAPSAKSDDTTARAGVDRLRLHDVKVRVTGVPGIALPGVEVRALHEQLDIAAAPVVTDSLGRATVRLPHGKWRVDVSRVDTDSGRCVFGRVRLDVDAAAGEPTIDLPEKRVVRFRSRLGAVRSPRDVTLSVPDFSFHAAVAPREGAFEIITTAGAPLVLQAVRPPDQSAGYVLRREVGAGTTVVVTDADGAATEPKGDVVKPDGDKADGAPAASAVTTTRFTFRGDEGRHLTPTIRSVDALPFSLVFAAKADRDVTLSGLSHASVSMEVERGDAKCAFYPLPIALDGTARTFTGEPPFAASVGIRHNTFGKYGDRKNSLTARVFLRDANGLVLRGATKQAAYTIGWEELLDGAVRASGTMKSWYVTRTAPIAAKDVARVRYKLHVKGPGEDRDVEVVPHTQTEAVSVGKVHTWCHPEIAPNARLWIACVNDAVRAYEDVTSARRARVDISLFSEMPPGLGGWGGWNGNKGFAFLPESQIFGFVEPTFFDGLTCHELGHVQGYGHDDAAQRRVMTQAGRRASRRYAAIRPGMTRLPEGNRFLPILEALTRGDLHAEDLPADGDDAGSSAHGDDGDRPKELEPDLDTTGEDDFLAWYLSSTRGVGTALARRSAAGGWRWPLTVLGYMDDEIEAAMLSRAAGEPLAWLARLRGLVASDNRVAAAAAEIAAGRKFPNAAERAAALKRWNARDLAKETDLDAARATLLAEVGDRDVRVTGLRKIAEQRLARGDRDAARAGFLAALAEARRGSKDDFDAALTACATAWAAR